MLLEYTTFGHVNISNVDHENLGHPTVIILKLHVFLTHLKSAS